MEFFQWIWTEKIAFLMGPIHTKMAFLNVIGYWLENSGWTTLIQNAGVTRPGLTQLPLSGYDVVRTNYSHHVNVCILHSLMQKAYNNYESNTSSTENFPIWRHEMERLHLSIQILVYCTGTWGKSAVFLIFVKSGNFPMYKNALKQLLLWLFALGHYHYARWLTIYWVEITLV